MDLLNQLKERNEEIKTIYENENNQEIEKSDKLFHNLWNLYLYKQMTMLEENLKKYIVNYDEIFNIEVNKSQLKTLLILSVLGKNNINL